MVSVEKLEYDLNIRRYGQLSEFGYCLHNGEKGDITAPRQPKTSRDKAGLRSDTYDLMSRL
jgi:hypothetical protein